MKVKLNDKILVISGKDKGKNGRVSRIITKHNRIVVEKVNMRTKHVKKTTAGPGEKIHFEAPINASNVVIMCPSCSKPTRAGYKLAANGKKERICKKCKQTLDQVVAEKGEKTTKKIKV